MYSSPGSPHDIEMNIYLGKLMYQIWINRRTRKVHTAMLYGDRPEGWATKYELASGARYAIIRADSPEQAMEKYRYHNGIK